MTSKEGTPSTISSKEGTPSTTSSLVTLVSLLPGVIITCLIFGEKFAEENVGKSWWDKHPVIGFRRLFYLVTPEESSFEKESQVPNYVLESFPYFGGLIVLEALILVLKKKPLPRINDTISSLSAGAISEMPGLFGRGAQMVTYVWVYNNWRLYELPWDSPWTWLLTFIGVDYGYYWVHRCGHEVNFMWASHSTHHSSEDYNLITALRQSVHHKFTNWIFYMPMALFVPPPVFLVHIQFNLLFQFWIHTEVIGDLGILEYIINTPSAHRVHHGRNRYCIDKNYGGTLIIWDILHGTFAREQFGEDKVVYGLVHPLQDWDPVLAQMGHVRWIINCVKTASSWTDALKHIVYGPGWVPGYKDRLGSIEDIPDVKYPQQRFNARPNSRILEIYCLLQFLLAFGLITFMQTLKKNMTQSYATLYVAYTVITLRSVANIMTNDSVKALLLEGLRCLLLPALSRIGLLGVGTLLTPEADYFLRLINFASGAFIVAAAAAKIGAASSKASLEKEAKSSASFDQNIVAKND